MKTVQKYVSDDGREFLGERECIAYEGLCKVVATIMSALPAKPALPSCQFENGGGYLQHDPIVAMAARNALLKLANTIMPHKWFQQTMDEENIHPSWASRLIDDMNEKCLRDAWYRFLCMTPDFREYGQPYYASNPEQAKDVCLNTVPA